MSLSTLLTLFLSHLGVGIIFSLLSVSRAAGVKFFRFTSGLALVLLLVALAFDPGAGGSSHRAAWHILARDALLATVLCTLAFTVLAGRALAWLQPWLLRGAALAGLLSILGNALTVAASPTLPVQLFTFASFATSAALLGTTCTAMILGHWYLVLPSMEVHHLMSMVKWMMGSLIARGLVIVAVIIFGAALWGAAGARFTRYIWSTSGIFFWQRALFGIAGPAVLGTLTWETAKIRSTQSATGILYVDLFAVIVGEVLSKYVTLATSLPV